ncbi:MAG: alkaline phosphatase family protein [Chitinophagaceae bacterium]
MKRCLVATFILFPFLASAQPVVKRPRLVIGIVVDQMRWDYLYRFQDRYGSGGFNRLLQYGFNCQQTFLNYIPSYTAPGHTSIYTGAYPALHGITGNDWPDRKEGKSVYCCEDATVRPVGGSEAAGRMSPHRMKATTIGDELRLATNFRSRVFGISLKDRGAILPAGHSANAAYWFDDSAGNFITSSFYRKALPEWVVRFNERRYADSMLAYPWNTLYPVASYRNSISDNNTYEYTLKGESEPVFPHRFGPGDYKAIRRSPRGNELSFLFAKELIAQEHLGERSCDMLALSLSATDYVGHAYAPNSVEAEDMYLRLDRQLASFLSFLDRHLGEGNYLLFLSADHGAAHNALWLQDQRVPAGTLSETALAAALNKYLKVQFGADSLVSGVFNYQVFLNESLLLSRHIDRAVLKAAVKQYCLSQEGIAYAADLENLASETMPGALKELLLNGYYPGRSGSVAVIYEPGWYSDGKKGTTHGTWNPYDRHIPLLWYGWHIPQGANIRCGCCY